MIRSDAQRNDMKRPRLDHKKKQFANAAYQDQDYPFRLNFYEIPPIAEISLEDFEKWAIDRLRSECL
jgi:DNA primase large subunit